MMDWTVVLPRLLASNPNQFRVHIVSIAISEEVEKLVTHHDVLPEGHRTMFVHDDVGSASYGSEPLTEFLSIADSC